MIRFIRSTSAADRAAAFTGIGWAFLTFGIAVYAFAMVTGS